MIERKKLINFERSIGYKFKDKSLLNHSLTHPSYYFENDIDLKKNQFERFEFLGDRVLGLVVANLLFKKNKQLNEGDLSKKYSYLVQKNFLFKIANELSLDKILLYNFKKKNNNRMLTSILSDSVESLIGAIFIDDGYLSSYKFINKYWSKYLDVDIEKTIDPKTTLQEISQQISKKLPEYKLVKKEGPSHSPKFTVALKVLKLQKITSVGTSIRNAEKNAAAIALNLINEKKTFKS